MSELVSYDLDADKQFRRTIRKAQRSGLDLSFAMGESARLIKKESGKNFILKGSGQYPPLSEKYAKRKQKLAPGTPILTGLAGATPSARLKKSIVGNTADSILLIGKRNLEIGTKATRKGASYPTFVQKGTKKMPARKFLFFSQRLVKQITNTVDAEIKRQLA